VPKLKTRKSASTRFSITGTGRLRRMKGHRNHMRRKKPASVRRQYSRKLEVSSGDAVRVRRMVPYGPR
jgi:large subunit ribosomal protein L35